MERIFLEKEDLAKESLVLSTDNNEVFQVVENLGETPLCYKGEISLRLQSLENPKKEITIFGYLNHKGQILIKGFKKLPTLN